MAAALPFISIGLSVIGGLRQMSAARHHDTAAESYEEAAVDTRLVAEANARRIEREAEEEHRRLKDEQERREATTRAYAAASGIAMSSGSVGTYLNEMEVEHRQQRQWLTSAAKEDADITRYEGYMQAKGLESEAEASRYRGDQQRWRGLSTMFSSIGQGFGAASGAGWI